MSKHTKISLWYLGCIFAGLSAAWADGAPLDTLILSGIFAACAVAGIFAAIIIRTKLSNTTRGK
jgi:hypothetical protein